MNMCPVDQFCFDKNTFILLIVGIILFVAHHIGNTNEKIDKLERNIENNDSRMTHKIKKYNQQLILLSNNYWHYQGHFDIRAIVHRDFLYQDK